MYSVFGNSNLYLFDADIKKMKAAEKVWDIMISVIGVVSEKCRCATLSP